MITPKFLPGAKVFCVTREFYVPHDAYYIPQINEDLTVKNTRVLVRNGQWVEYLSFVEIGDYFIYPANAFRALDLDFAQSVLDYISGKNDCQP